jgi:pSer/pThr/pTyr-binding forkhead associated (FHA) protein
MKAYYLALEEELIRRSVYPLFGSITIGRGAENTIVLADPMVSREHAKIGLSDGGWWIEDAGSANGIFVDGNRLEKAALDSAKTYRIGNSALRFRQRDESGESKRSLPSAEILSAAFQNLGLPAEEEARSWSKRLFAAIGRVPFLSPVPKAELTKLATRAALHLLREGQTVLSESDRGRSIYVVLSGRVRIFTMKQQGKPLDLATLESGDFFGEMAFLSGKPRAANVAAAAATLLLEISFPNLKDLILEHASAKKVLVDCYHQRLAATKKKLDEIGFKERRREPRTKDILPVNLAMIAATKPQADGGQTSWEVVSSDISGSGIKVALPEVDPARFRVGDQLMLQIHLPEPWGSTRAIGQVRQVSPAAGTRKTLLLGIKFVNMTLTDARKLREYVYGDTQIAE